MSESGPSHPERIPYESEKLSGIRKIIAKRMSQSAREAPHFQVAREIDMSRSVAFRKRLKETGENITFNDLVLKATALALKMKPRMNCSFEKDELRLFREINVGFVVAIEDGLTVPVIRETDKKSLAEINAQTGQMAKKARDKKLTARHTLGGTFTVSNLGMFDSDAVIPIIFPGQAGILGVGAIRQTAVVVEDKIEIRPACKFWLSCDHRAVDGVIAAEFLNALDEILQNPEQLRADNWKQENIDANER